MCKRMLSWSDTPPSTSVQCEENLERAKDTKPEAYACLRRCVPASDSNAAMSSCLSECSPSGNRGTPTASTKKQSVSNVHFQAGSGKSGSCSATLTLDGFYDRRGSGLCSYDSAQNEFGAKISLSKGKSVKLGDKSVNFSGSNAEVTFPAGKLIAETKTDSLSVSVPMELTDDHGTWKGELSFLSSLITDALKQVDKGPVRFAGEDLSTAGGTASLLLVGGYTVKAFGATVALKDLDLVAISSSRTRRFSKCTYTKSGGKRKSVSRTSFDKQVTVYDRRSGKRLGGKLFKAATPSCPSTVKESDYTVSKHVAQDATYSFLKSFVR